MTMKAIWFVILALLGFMPTTDQLGEAGTEQRTVQSEIKVTYNGTSMETRVVPDIYKIDVGQMEEMKKWKQENQIHTYSDLIGIMAFEVLIPKQLPKQYELTQITRENDKYVKFLYQDIAWGLGGTVMGEFEFTQYIRGSHPDESSPSYAEKWGKVNLVWGEGNWTKGQYTDYVLQWQYEELIIR